MPQTDGPNRRHAPRLSATLECKVLRPWTTSYLAARTADISESGVLLVIEAGSPLRVGEEVEIGFSWAGEALIIAERMVKGTVVRAGGSDLRMQPVAVEFNHAQTRVRSLRPAA